MLLGFVKPGGRSGAILKLINLNIAIATLLVISYYCHDRCVTMIKCYHVDWAPR